MDLNQIDSSAPRGGNQNDYADSFLLQDNVLNRAVLAKFKLEKVQPLLSEKINLKLLNKQITEADVTGSFQINLKYRGVIRQKRGKKLKFEVAIEDERWHDMRCIQVNLEPNNQMHLEGKQDPRYRQAVLKIGERRM